VTLWEIALAFVLVGLGIIVGDTVAELQRRARHRLPFHPRLR
jgi:hypothetical protein